jgi:hypothetical protein
VGASLGQPRRRARARGHARDERLEGRARLRDNCAGHRAPQPGKDTGCASRRCDPSDADQRPRGRAWGGHPGCRCRQRAHRRLTPPRNGPGGVPAADHEPVTLPACARAAPTCRGHRAPGLRLRRVAPPGCGGPRRGTPMPGGRGRGRGARDLPELVPARRDGRDKSPRCNSDLRRAPCAGCPQRAPRQSWRHGGHGGRHLRGSWTERLRRPPLLLRAPHRADFTRACRPRVPGCAPHLSPARCCPDASPRRRRWPRSWPARQGESRRLRRQRKQWRRGLPHARRWRA